MSWMGKHEKCFSFFDSFLAQGKSNLHCVRSRVLQIPAGVGLTGCLVLEAVGKKMLEIHFLQRI